MMNQFLQQYGQRIHHYWENSSEEQHQQLLADIRSYANADQQRFKQEIAEVQFDSELSALALVFEALSRDTDNWGAFYEETLDTILNAAYQAPDPKEILGNLMEFAYIEEDEKPYVQQIVDRLHAETNSANPAIKLAAIFILPGFLANPSLRNKAMITESLQQKLYDQDWKVRYIAFKYLGFENLLPEGYKLSLADRARKMVFGEPKAIE